MTHQISKQQLTAKKLDALKEIASQLIATECDRFGLSVQENGAIYQGTVKLGEAGCFAQHKCTESRWWVIRASSQYQQAVPCDDLFDAVWSLLIDAPLVLLNPYKPFDELITAPIQRLKDGEFQEDLEFSRLVFHK